MTMLMFMVKKDRDQNKVRHYKQSQSLDWRQRRWSCFCVLWDWKGIIM